MDKLWQVLEQHDDTPTNDNDRIWIFLNHKGDNKIAYNIRSPSMTTDWIDINNNDQLINHLEQIRNDTDIHSLAVRLNNGDEDTLSLLKRLDI